MNNNIEVTNNINIDFIVIVIDRTQYLTRSDAGILSVKQQSWFDFFSWLCWGSTKLIVKFAQNQISSACKPREIITERSSIGPAPPSPLAVQCSASPDVEFSTGSSQDYLPTWASPIFVPAYQKRLPAFPSPVTFRDRLLLSYLTPTTHARFPSPPLPRCLQNLF